MHACDVLLMLAPISLTSSSSQPTQKIAQVDIRAENLGRRCELDSASLATSATIEALLPRLKTKTARGYLDDAVAHYKKSDRAGRARQGTPATSRSIPSISARGQRRGRGRRGLYCRRRHSDDLGARYLKMNGSRRLVGSWAHAPCQRNGPWHRGRGRFSRAAGDFVVGHGGFTMLMGDLITLTQMSLPLKVVIFNNSVLGFVGLK